MDIPDGYDIISMEEGGYSVSENEDIGESLEHQIQALSLNMLHHFHTVKRLGEDKAGWRPSILLPPHQMSCEHDWHHNEVVENPSCVCCRCQSMKRARIHCPECGVVSCNMCGPHYFDREVPLEPATYTAEGPAQARAFIKAQSEYIQWCDVKKDRLHRENMYLRDCLLQKDLKQDLADLGTRDPRKGKDIQIKSPTLSESEEEANVFTLQSTSNSASSEELKGPKETQSPPL